MQPLRIWLARFLRIDDGPTAVEYAVMLALIVAICMVAVDSLSSAVNNAFNNTGAAMSNPANQRGGAGGPSPGAPLGY